MTAKQKNRVVITGLGAVTPAGRGVADLWESLKAGKSQVSKLSLFDSTTFQTKIAAEVKNFNFEKEFKGFAKDPTIGNLNRHAQFALMAAWEAFHSSRLDRGGFDTEKFGVYFASGEGGVDFVNFANCVLSSLDPNNPAKVDKEAYIRRTHEFLNADKEMEQEPGMTLYHLAKFYGARGPVFNCLTACAASSQAIGESPALVYVVRPCGC